MPIQRVNHHAHTDRRSGFTLVELLVVITIMLLLLSMTVYAVNFSRESDRVGGGARQLQSALSGARDRAIHAKAPRGVRFFLDSTDFTDANGNQLAENRRTVTAMCYIDPDQLWSDGRIELHRWDLDNDGRTDTTTSADLNGDGVIDANDNAETTKVWMVYGVGTGWWELKRRALLFDGLRIRIPKGPSGTWYAINTQLIDVTVPPAAVQRLVLTTSYVEPGETQVEVSKAFDGSEPGDYEIELPPRILPQEPILLPKDTVIDLDGSRIPAAWSPSAATGGEFSQFMDVVFSPRGNVVGAAASRGLLHFYVCDNQDSIAIKQAMAGGPNLSGMNAFLNSISTPPPPLIPADEIDPANPNTASWAAINPAAALTEPGTPYLVHERRLVSLYTQTGGISIHPVNPTDTNLDGIADDPYRLAELGETAK